MTHFALASFQMKKKTLKLSRLPHYLAITNHSTVQFPVGFSLRQMFKLPGALLGRQVEEGIPSFFFSSANDEHLFTVPIPLSALGITCQLL